MRGQKAVALVYCWSTSFDIGPTSIQDRIIHQHLVFAEIMHQFMKAMIGQIDIFTGLQRNAESLAVGTVLFQNKQIVNLAYHA